MRCYWMLLVVCGFGRCTAINQVLRTCSSLCSVHTHGPHTRTRPGPGMNQDLQCIRPAWTLGRYTSCIISPRFQDQIDETMHGACSVGKNDNRGLLVQVALQLCVVTEIRKLWKTFVWIVEKILEYRIALKGDALSIMI